MKKHTLFFLIFSGILLAGSSVLNIIFSFYLGNIVQASVELNMELFKESAVLSILIVTSALILEILGHNCRYKFGMLKSLKYKDKMISRVLNMGFQKFYKNDQSYYINLMTKECDMVRDHYYMQFPSFIECSAQIIFGFSALLFISVKFTLLCAIVFLMPIIIPSTLAKVLARKQNTLSEENKRYILSVKSVIEGFEVIKCNKLFDKVLTQYTNINSKVEKADYSLSSISNIKDSLTQFLGFISQLSSIVIGVFLIFNGEMTVATLFAAINIVGNIVQPIADLSHRMGWVSSTQDIRKKHKIIFNEKETDVSNKEPKQKLDEIEIRNLTFSYENGNDILKNVNLVFNRGKKYIIKGRSGAGKSTLLKLIMGYYDNFEGNIFFNGKDINEIDKYNLYSNMHMIHQNIFLFNDTLANNIFLDKEFDEELYNDIIKKTRLEELRDDLASNGSVIIDNGVRLSGGEKQRISLARALVNESSILLVDEVTSSLDEESSNAVYEILIKMHDVTSIIITHSINDEICKEFDDIIHLNEGSIDKSVA